MWKSTSENAILGKHIARLHSQPVDTLACTRVHSTRLVDFIVTFLPVGNSRILALPTEVKLEVTGKYLVCFDFDLDITKYVSYIEGK
jgi:hypothetical protein